MNAGKLGRVALMATAALLVGLAGGGSGGAGKEEDGDQDL